VGTYVLRSGCTDGEVAPASSSARDVAKCFEGLRAGAFSFSFSFGGSGAAMVGELARKREWAEWLEK
jgi:hypothetical protein